MILLLLLLLNCNILFINSITEENSIYFDVVPANTSDSLYRLYNVPIKLYSFRYDSITDRKQMGILGADAQRWFPDSVEVVPRHTIVNRNRTEKDPTLTVLKNFPIVNKQVIYMHGLAALQELSKLYYELYDSILELKNSGSDHNIVFAEIEKRLSKEADEQLIEKKKLAMAESELARKEVELERIRAEEDRKTIEIELKQEKELLIYEEELTRQRMNYSQYIASQNLIKTLELERELLLKRENLRKEISLQLQEKRLYYEKQLEEYRQNNEKDKILTEIKTRAEQERLNEDVTIRKLQAQSKVDTEKMVYGIKTISNQISKIIIDIIARPKQLLLVASILCFVMAIYYIIREIIIIMRQFIQSRLGRPSLIRETSKYSLFIPEFIYNLFLLKKIDQLILKNNILGLNEHFRDVILSDEDKERVIQLALTTRNTKRTGAPFRHVLLYGPPGTGKTLIARKLAECSNMDYAIMSGGDVGPLGEDAVNQLHSLFKWAANSHKGLLLFIDEAEAFLSSRNNNNKDNKDNNNNNNDNVSIHIRHALNALLYQTGTQSTTFMLVLATNRPEDLDAAVLDRMDVSHYIGLPGIIQRQQLIELYYKLHLHKNNLFNIFTIEEINKYSEQLNGFSGREISKLFIAIKYSFMLSNIDNNNSTSNNNENNNNNIKNVMDTIIQQKIREHIQKQGFLLQN